MQKTTDDLSQLFGASDAGNNGSVNDADLDRQQRIVQRASRDTATRDVLGLFLGWLWALTAGLIAPVAASLSQQRAQQVAARQKIARQIESKQRPATAKQAGKKPTEKTTTTNAGLNLPSSSSKPNEP